MGVIYNATNEEQSVQAFGNWFTFKSNQIKVMQDHIVKFLAEKRREDGLVEISDKFEDPSYQDTPEGKEMLKHAKREGIESYLKKQMWLVNNNLQSLRNDLRMKNIDTDPQAFMSEGEMKALEILAKYKQAGLDEQQQRVDKAKELEKKLGLK